MPTEGWSKKRAEALCDRLLCEAKEGSSRTEGSSLCAVGRRSDRRRKWNTDSARGGGGVLRNPIAWGVLEPPPFLKCSVGGF